MSVKVRKMIRKHSRGTSNLRLHNYMLSSQDMDQHQCSDTDEFLPTTMSHLRINNEANAKSTVISNLHAKLNSGEISGETSASLKDKEENGKIRCSSSERRRNKAFCFLEPVKDNSDCILEESTSNEPLSDPAGSILNDESSTNSQGEEPLSPESNAFLSTSSMLALPISRQRSKNFSASSLDSGVGSAHNSKRPSLELASPDPARSGFIMFDASPSQPRSRCLLQMDGENQSINKENNPNIIEESVPIIVEDKLPKTGRTRLSVDEQAFSQLLRAASEVVSSANLSASTGLLDTLRNEQCLKNSLQDYKSRRKSQWDIPTTMQNVSLSYTVDSL